MSDDNVLHLPERVRVPPPPEDPFLRWIEHVIIKSTAEAVEFDKPQARPFGLGLSTARTKYILLQGGELEEPIEYLSTVITVVTTLSRRMREKLRHPACDRDDQQKVLDSL